MIYCNCKQSKVVEAFSCSNVDNYGLCLMPTPNSKYYKTIILFNIVQCFRLKASHSNQLIIIKHMQRISEPSNDLSVCKINLQKKLDVPNALYQSYMEGKYV